MDVVGTVTIYVYSNVCVLHCVLMCYVATTTGFRPEFASSRYWLRNFTLDRKNKYKLNIKIELLDKEISISESSSKIAAN